MEKTAAPAESSNSINQKPLVLPRHVAIIMDGNGRWAKERRLPRIEGHRAGGKTVRMVVEECRRLGISYLTLFAFSSENWKRPAAEVQALMKLFEQYLRSEQKLLLQNGVRLKVLGARETLPSGVQLAIAEVEEATASQTGLQLNLAVSYGGRGEIVYAAKRLAEQVARGELKSSEITEELLAKNLYLPDVPDPDLLIRSSAELRISNFLLWELAYSEIVVSPLYWPDFSKAEFQRCLAEFSGRKRRFGLTEEQLKDGKK